MDDLSVIAENSILSWIKDLLGIKDGCGYTRLIKDLFSQFYEEVDSLIICQMSKLCFRGSIKDFAAEYESFSQVEDD